MSRFTYARDHLTKDDYDAFFADRASLAWPEAMNRLLSRPSLRKPEKIPRFLSDQRRNDFIFLLPISPKWRVLDFGSGWGNTSFTLSHYCESVVAMEADSDRLRFSADHFTHRMRSNITPVCAKGGERLPFADAEFDAVVMNGVLEWTATAAPGNPGEVHKRVLSEVNRVLKPGGWAAISIENRYSYEWFAGKRDHHATGLRWVSFLPRRLADFYSRVWAGQPYRTWFYSASKLRDLLAQCGFRDTRLFAYHPNHIRYTDVFGVDDSANARAVTSSIAYAHAGITRRQRIAYQLARAGLPFRWIAHDFLAIVRKPGPAAIDSDTLDGAIREHYGAGADITFNLLSRRRSVMIQALQGGVPVGLLKYPREGSLRGNIHNEIEMLRAIAALALPGPVTVPAVLKSGESFGRPWLLMSYMEGHLSGDLAALDANRIKILQWLIALAKASAGKKAAHETVQRWWSTARSALPHDARAPDCGELADVRTAAMHGDLSPNNILVGSRLSVIDWEFGELDGLPAIDLIDFLLFLQYRGTQDYRQAWTKLFASPDGAHLRRELRAYLEAMDIPREHLPLLARIFLVRKIASLVGGDGPKSQRKLAELVALYGSHEPARI